MHGCYWPGVVSTRGWPATGVDSVPEGVELRYRDAADSVCCHRTCTTTI